MNRLKMSNIVTVLKAALQKKTVKRLVFIRFAHLSSAFSGRTGWVSVINCYL